MKIIFLIISIYLLTACSNTNNSFLALKAIAPTVNLENFQLIKMGLSKQVYRLRLHIKNPNSFPLPIQNLTYQLFINEQSFAKGLSNKSVVIPALGDGYLETDVSSNLMDVVEGWGQWFSLAKQTLNYKIEGNIGVTSFAIPFPFQYSDKVDLQLIK
ncbi:MAG: LEA type 2 family protein [Methylococcales bacterium]|nr:LEA type 2 family protein [Methylococcales bacterium]